MDDLTMVKETKSREDFRAIEFFFVRRMERRGGGGVRWGEVVSVVYDSLLESR